MAVSRAYAAEARRAWVLRQYEAGVPMERLAERQGTTVRQIREWLRKARIRREELLELGAIGAEDDD